MGLFSMVGDVLGSLHDMKELGKVQGDIEGAIEDLIKSDKCPEGLKKAYEATKDVDKDTPLEESMGMMKDFAKSLVEHCDVLPDGIAKKAKKYAEVVKDLEEKSDDIMKLTGHNK